MRKATLLDPSRQKLKSDISDIIQRTAEDVEEKRTPKARFRANYWKYFFNLICTIGLFPLLFNYGYSVTTYATCRGAFVFLLTILCWLSESIPMPITALMPATLFPLLGIISSEAILPKLFNDSILVLFGGMLLAATFEFSRLHKRIALKTIVTVGSSTNRLLFGVMAVTGILSGWMNNTAVTAMMAPIILAILEEYRFSLHKSINAPQEGLALEDPEVQGQERVDTNEDVTSLSSAEKDGGRIENKYEKGKTINGSTKPAMKLPIEKSLANQMKNRNKISPNNEESVGGNELKSARSLIVTEELYQSPESMGSRIFTGYSNQERDNLKKQLALSKFLYNYKIMFLLATAYAANLGGTGLLIGSGTNIAALDPIAKEANVADDGAYANLSFVTWAVHNFPPMLCNLAAAYCFLVIWCTDFLKRKCGRKRTAEEFVLTKDIIAQVDKAMFEAYHELGPITVHEIGVIAVFVATMLAWIFHEPQIFPGWKQIFKATAPTLATPAIAANILIFIIPRTAMFYHALFPCSNKKCDFTGVRYQTLMGWHFIQERFPWGIVLLLGGGFALSLGFKASGLGNLVGNQLHVLRSLPKEGILLIILFITSFLTECASNTAIASIFVPILLTMSRSFGVHPLYFALGSATACSFSFMLPIATPPNAIVYTAGKLKSIDMIKPGFFMNIITAFIHWLFTISYGDLVFHYSSYKYLCFRNSTRPNGSNCEYKGPHS